MQAQEIMISDVYTVKESDTVGAVIAKFITHRISGVPIINTKSKIVGYISDGDIMRYIGTHEHRIFDSLYYFTVIKDDEEFPERIKLLLDLKVLKIAQSKVIKVSWDEEVENIATILGKKKIKKLPVERNGVLVGIISRGDVIRHCFKDLLQGFDH
ncbi:CBS domain-containing protein [Desulfosporosinus nitroreducens]|uniref:CBS domain-containing protein n=1 Tax=Desulfosporosinus nitroreducens TaxID=2018668 RepID=UPI00207D1285|nr:CBS domain-containing protein [Desulfosporosinus nitroreducens]MCO1603861.1 CBS domain-containing protein [Desulfosporosinus nitroreducens]